MIKSYSVAMTKECDNTLRGHLLRKDRQEDLCFAIWHPSAGASRMSALINKLILPGSGDRSVHGNVSFNPQYIERAMSEANAAGGGLALLHSHPDGRGWQDMSRDDINAERGNAGRAFGATELPLVGLTMAGDGSWSARFWPRVAPRQYQREDCGTVRVVGDVMAMHFYEKLLPRPLVSKTQIRTVASWGVKRQAELARLRIGVVGGGSVGGMIAEALARTGIENVKVIDFDCIEEHNLDRLVYATRRDIGELKVDVLSRRLPESSTANNFKCDPIPAAVYEEVGFRAALDCDVLFSCVDRPWGRHVLNLIAYAHLIPVFDGGIAVKTKPRGDLLRADWKAHTCAPGRACMACLGQYSTGLVQTEREGLLDDPKYIEGLPSDHALKARENVFAFSMCCASFQMMQMLNYVLVPLDLPGPLPQMYHFVGGFMESTAKRACDEDCPFTALVGTGDNCGYNVLGKRTISPEMTPPTPEPQRPIANRLWRSICRIFN
ncbi:ThiF family adenylyltransferase [Rhizobium leguminosarum]|uniref:ThiF family adenylyltransferase n=1 Tax=Rhizobium leguminosarum TaxID=384 RepID=UPI001C985F6E|nr:ThiF family adenylyltransferase [Rhizobium leguminosarum]